MFWDGDPKTVDPTSGESGSADGRAARRIGLAGGSCRDVRQKSCTCKTARSWRIAAPGRPTVSAKRAEDKAAEFPGLVLLEQMPRTAHGSFG